MTELRLGTRKGNFDGAIIYQGTIRAYEEGKYLHTTTIKIPRLKRTKRH